MSSISRESRMSVENDNHDMHTLRYGSEGIRYRIARVVDRKPRIAIHVEPDGSVLVDAPMETGLTEIRNAVQKRARWILGHVENARKRREHVLPREYVSGESHFYLGRRYLLKVMPEEGRGERVTLFRGQFRVETDTRESARVKQLLWEWVRTHGQDYVSRRLASLVDSIPLGDAPPAFRLVTMRKQWGSCSPRGTLLINPHLIKAPRICIDYVLLHELCHLQEHNHSPRFYRLLEERMPEWKSVKARLDGMSELVLNA